MIAIPTAGVACYSQPVPNNNALAGINVYLQALQIEATSGGPLWEPSSSNRLTFIHGVF
ncbi:MAG: hypothetical protein ACI89X_000608 [Planctomycetota bacterium]|jgi:hypothetical protein